ncbi:hypothetical protein KFK09_028260 [Dendrobium nobile]|uniref:Endonuclease/exonuclease/phosphatase domain-containing protein n=1 Tax=Dendrobium nobile TaxID=94219 RepID=A0A8T3A2W1_DENNO|nr:hypothetical protein KFK09_028260 [Dendrobium nobile]
MNSSLAFWNCRGARKRKASLYLKEFVKEYGVCFIGLLETKVSDFDRKDVDQFIGTKWDFVHVPSEGLSGGILILWKSNVSSFHVLESTSQVIVGDLEMLNVGVWRIASVYAKKDSYVRRMLWEKLEFYNSKEIPMIIGGDFNCILSSEDKRGGRRFNISLGTKEMKIFLANNDFHEVNFVGPKFTWCNNKKGVDRILERLDRCFINTAAISSKNRFFVRNLARVASDHCPILLNFTVQQASKKIMRYEDVWASNKASMAVVEKVWRRNYKGNASKILNSKMKNSLKALYFWSKAKLKNLISQQKELIIQIEELQLKEANDGFLSDDECWKLKSKVEELNSTLARLNTWWRQRAKVKWLTEGDRNSNFFQAYASARIHSNFIAKIKDGMGEVIEDQATIHQVLQDHFKEKWKFGAAALKIGLIAGVALKTKTETI